MNVLLIVFGIICLFCVSSLIYLFAQYFMEKNQND